MEFEKLKKKFPTDRPIPEKKGRVRGNKNIFKVGLRYPHTFKKNCITYGEPPDTHCPFLGLTGYQELNQLASLSCTIGHRHIADSSG